MNEGIVDSWSIGWNFRNFGNRSNFGKIWIDTIIIGSFCSTEDIVYFTLVVFHVSGCGEYILVVNCFSRNQLTAEVIRGFDFTAEVVTTINVVGNGRIGGLADIPNICLSVATNTGITSTSDCIVGCSAKEVDGGVAGQRPLKATAIDFAYIACIEIDCSIET